MGCICGNPHWSGKEPGPDPGRYTLKELCRMLSVSPATGSNWMRQGKILPDLEENGTFFFSKNCADHILEELENGDNLLLKRRRNKTFVSGTAFVRGYAEENSGAAKSVREICRILSGKTTAPEDGLIEALLAECALRLLFCPEGGSSADSLLEKALNGELASERAEEMILPLVSDPGGAAAAVREYPEAFRTSYVFEKEEDTLGLLYLSLRSLGGKKKSGTYYTPPRTAQRLCRTLFSGREGDLRLLDPCCGSGSFLLLLPPEISPEQIYGMDIDATAIQIARINLALRTGVWDSGFWARHLTAGNYLEPHDPEAYDLILGNPPWGSAWSEEEQASHRIRYRSAAGNRAEAYDLFAEQALKDLKSGGTLAFLLPEAVLNIQAHKIIREVLLESCAFVRLEYLGNLFRGVQCPCVFWEMKKTGKKTDALGMEVKEQGRGFRIGIPRKPEAEGFAFRITDEEYSVCEKLRSGDSRLFLKGHAEFALGIVTGNNKEFLSDEPGESREGVFRGTDIFRYRTHSAGRYLTFRPEQFQQAAAERLYRAPEKLVYRFICEQLVFALDDSGSLTLNSCNLLIPGLPGVKTRYILAVLNSRIAQFYFQMRFRSVKVLRSHIESIPIPEVSPERQEEIVSLVSRLTETADMDSVLHQYNHLDRKVAECYGLDSEEYALILDRVGSRRLLLG